VKAPKLAVTTGAVVPPLIPAYQGFVNGDTASSLTTPATCTTTATSSSPPASYPVTCSGAVDPDYAITYAAGSVTVVALRSQTISFSPPTTATVGTSVTLSATGGASGEPVVFSIDHAGGAGVCTSTGPDGSDVSFDAPGACVVDADQAGTATFAAAEDQQVITVLPSGPTGPTGRGYWLVGSDGGVFADGNGFYGSGVALHLDRPVVGMAATPDGKGYWLVAADGGVFAFGDAPYSGSGETASLDHPVVGVAADPDGRGYWLSTADGGVLTFGDAPAVGNQAGLVLNGPVVSMAG